MSTLKKLVKKLLPTSLVNQLRLQKLKSEWKKGQPADHLVKQDIIAHYQAKFNTPIMVETGTYLGDMVEAQKHRFSKVYSIELSNELFKKATDRFRNDKNITILEGDSGKVLHNLIGKIDKPALFWLDGHYSAGFTAKGEKECPIYEELDAILKDKESKHVLLIDDARLFVGKNDYPTIEELKSYIQSRIPSYKMELDFDVIRFTC